MTQKSGLARVGVILHRGPDDPYYNALRDGLAQLGYAEGQNIAFEPRFAHGQLDRTSAFASELVRLGVDVIVAVGGVGARAAQRATNKIPVLFAIVLDPVAAGFAASIERPGGNVTGVTNSDPGQATEQLKLIKAVVPSLRRTAILSDEDAPRRQLDGWNPLEKSNDTAARALGLEPYWVRMKGPMPDLEGAVTSMKSAGAEALLVLEVPVTLSRFRQIADLAIAHRLPALLPAGEVNDALMSYGTSLLDTIPSLSAHVDRILKGTAPANLPIETVSRRRLGINLKTARALGVTIPSEILNKADEIVP
jgi:putative tryptophan/tyrosine transport system substrate-binding protein